jgi:acid phosphatase (class A)
MRHFCGALFFFLSCLTGLAQAPIDDSIRFEAWGKWAVAALNAPPYFLSREDLINLPVNPPPANSSPETRADLNELLQLQRQRTRAQVRTIRTHLEYDAVCAAVCAATHQGLNHKPKTRALLEHVQMDASLAVFHVKQRFNRARPHQLDPRIHPAIQVPAHPAYPSGHALQSYMVALTLSLLFPDSAQDLMNIGIQIGREREIAGLHYPSDSKASRALGEELFNHLEQNEKFQAEVAAAKEEWRPSRGG